MNTFLPYESFRESARCLDRLRLGKQRVEVLQLLQGSFPNHPAAMMWEGYRSALASYGLVICHEWRSRGYQDTCWDKISEYVGDKIVYPPWLQDKKFHDSHKSNLLRKDPAHYGQFGWDVPTDLPYVWPNLRPPIFQL